jgi:hypothetical protein
MTLERKKIIPCGVWIAKEIRNGLLDDADSTRREKYSEDSAFIPRRCEAAQHEVAIVCRSSSTLFLSTELPVVMGIILRL